MNLKRLLKIYKFPKNKTNSILKQWTMLFFNNKKVDRNIMRTKVFQQKALTFMVKLKSAFYGIICDWEN